MAAYLASFLLDCIVIVLTTYVAANYYELKQLQSASTARIAELEQKSIKQDFFYTNQAPLVLGSDKSYCFDEWIVPQQNTMHFLANFSSSEVPELNFIYLYLYRGASRDLVAKAVVDIDYHFDAEQASASLIYNERVTCDTQFEFCVY